MKSNEAPNFPVDVTFLAGVLDRSPDFVTVIGRDGRLLYANQRARSFFGIEPGMSLRGLTADEAGFTADARARLRKEVWPALLRDGEWTGELTMRGPHGELVTVLQSSQLHRDERGAVACVSGIGRDITELTEAHARLRHVAEHDPLTDLPNRAAAIAHLERGVATAPEQPAAMLFVDLDRFKNVNDEYGHVTGDALLVAVAERIRGAVRPGDFVARLGGDEFVVVCADATMREGRRIARRVIAALTTPFHIGPHDVSVGASVGVAALNDDATTALQQADAAMYLAKRNGGGLAIGSTTLHTPNDAPIRLGD